MNKKIIFGGLLGLAIMAGTITTAYAHESGNAAGKQNLSDKNYEARQERREAMQANRGVIGEFVENNDYTGWEKLMQEKVQILQERARNFSEKINQGNFDQRVQIHELMREGKHEEAYELKEELGIGAGHGMRGGMGSRKWAPQE